MTGRWRASSTSGERRSTRSIRFRSGAIRRGAAHFSISHAHRRTTHSSSAWTGTGSARWLAEKYPEAVKHAVFFYGQQAAAERGAKRAIEARKPIGWNYEYDVAVSPLHYLPVR